MKTEKKPSRLSLPKTALPRKRRIDRIGAEIASGKYPNSEDLARLCETSISTINRDIKFMHDQLFAPIEYDPFNRGYFYACYFNGPPEDMEIEKKPSHLSQPETPLSRADRIDRIREDIASGKYPNLDDLARLYKTSIDIINRDIEFMKDKLFEPIEYDPLNQGYFYTCRSNEPPENK